MNVPHNGHDFCLLLPADLYLSDLSNPFEASRCSACGRPWRSSVRCARRGLIETEDHPLSLPIVLSLSMIRCCYCDFESSENGVRAHVAKVHKASTPPRIWGRTAGPVCNLCGWSHTATDATPRDGWGNRRKHLERGKIVAVQAAIPGPGRFYTLGEFAVPTGVTGLKRVVVTIEPCHGPFLGTPDSQGRRYCSRDQRYHFVVAERREALA